MSDRFDEPSIDDAVDAVNAARYRLDCALVRLLPEGTAVFWKKGVHQQAGSVRWTNMQRVGVRNTRTGAEYTLEAYQLTEKWGGGIST